MFLGVLVPIAYAEAPIAPSSTVPPVLVAKRIPPQADPPKPPPVVTNDSNEVLLRKLQQCENPSGDPTTRILDVNGRYSHGNFMYQMQTWLAYSKLFGTTEENIYDPVLQEQVTIYILNRGGWKNWYNCSLKIGLNTGWNQAQ